MQLPPRLGHMSTDAAFGVVPEVTLGWRMKIARDLAGMDQEALAKATGIARNTISNYELGLTARPKRLYIRAMAQAMGVSESWLETGQAEPTSGPGLTLVAGPGFEPGTSGL